MIILTSKIIIVGRQEEVRTRNGVVFFGVGILGGVGGY